jgi:hypothetical protein
MRYRITLWAAVGLLVPGFWAFYALPSFVPTTVGETLLYTRARVTQPIVAVGTYFHFGIRLYWVLLANAATYALVGLMAESLRQKRSPEH